MSKNTSVTLGDHFDKFIENQIKSGRYGSASEVIRTGLRSLENTENKLQTLRTLLDEGEKSGLVDYSYENIISEIDNS